MDKEEFLRVTGVADETFSRLEDGAKVQLLNAVGHAISEAKNSGDAERLASEAVRVCCEGWNRAIEYVTQFVVPPGETHSPASRAYELSRVEAKVSQ